MTKNLIKRNKLLDQGVHFLMIQGYHGTGVSEITKAAGIPKSSFYSYFESKEAFAAEAITHYIEPFIQRLKTHIYKSQNDTLTALKNYYVELAGSRYFCESLFWASQPKQAAKT